MRAEILAVGSELLTPLRSDTNALYLTAKLLEIGITVGARITVADDPGLLESAFRSALARADIVIATGGLGPTEDDLTREAAAAALGRRLQREPALIDELKARFAKYGRVMAAVNEKQADVIEGGTVLRNPRGTAPGQLVEKDDAVLVLLPGPPWEMQPMFEEQVLERLRARAGGRVVHTRVLKIAARGESDVEQVIAPFYKTFTNPRTTILGGPGEVELHLVAEAESDAAAEARIEDLARGIRERLPGAIYSEDGRDLHEVVGALLVERRLTIAVAESCTGGLLTERLTRLSGSSAYVDRTWVTYSNRAKVEMLGVDEGLLESAGAVSGEVAEAMAKAARERARTDIGVGITGIAGPTGGTPEKPVGLVFIALAGAAGDKTRRFQGVGNRDRVRFQATQVALEMIRRGLLAIPPI